MPARRKKQGPDLASLGELQLIERIRKMVPVPRHGAPQKVSVIEGIGDDAAVLRLGRSKDLLIATCDTLIEEVHFRKATPPYRIGWKAMAVNFSDIAAMGAIPHCALVSLACPAGTKVSDIDRLYAGMVALADRFGVSIVGGDTVESPCGLALTVTVVGTVEEDRYVTRAGARAGDVVCVTGSLGGSLAGKHLTFLPRVEEGRFLATRCAPTAMIDISDGLANDLMRIMEASRTTAEVFAEAVPVSQAAVRSAECRNISPLESALYDGEDFELLFTLRKDKADACLDLFRKEFSAPVTTIGRVKKGPGRPALVKADGTTVALEAGGYEHFKKGTSKSSVACED